MTAAEGQDIIDEFYQTMNAFMDAIDGSYCKYEGQRNPTGGKLECGVFKPTIVLSVSYSVEEHYYPLLWQERACNEYEELPVTFATLPRGQLMS